VNLSMGPTWVLLSVIVSCLVMLWGHASQLAALPLADAGIPYAG
jgi:hypothetical protein